MIRLQLTSPHMGSNNRTVRTHVKIAQNELKRHGWLQGEVDGEYGPDTMRATKRAQYYMGFTLKNIDGVYNQYLEDRLNGSKGLRPDQLARRKLRLRPNPRPKRIRHLEEMCKLVKKGLTEHPPNSNRVPGVTDVYGLVGPWCAMVESVTGRIAGFVKTFVMGSYYAYCPFIFADAQRGVRNLAITYRPLPGDIVLYHFGSGIAKHTGLYATEEYLKRFCPAEFAEAQRREGTPGANEFWAVEGNTGVGNDANGGMQMIRKRQKSLVQAFVHVGEK